MNPQKKGDTAGDSSSQMRTDFAGEETLSGTFLTAWLAAEAHSPGLRPVHSSRTQHRCTPLQPRCPRWGHKKDDMSLGVSL